jgi:hypothetical protein
MVSVTVFGPVMTVLDALAFATLSLRALEDSPATDAAKSGTRSGRPIDRDISVDCYRRMSSYKRASR